MAAWWNVAARHLLRPAHRAPGRTAGEDTGTHHTGLVSDGMVYLRVAEPAESAPRSRSRDRLGHRRGSVRWPGCPPPGTARAGLRRRLTVVGPSGTRRTTASAVQGVLAGAASREDLDLLTPRTTLAVDWRLGTPPPRWTPPGGPCCWTRRAIGVGRRGDRHRGPCSAAAGSSRPACTPYAPWRTPPRCAPSCGPACVGARRLGLGRRSRPPRGSLGVDVTVVEAVAVRWPVRWAPRIAEVCAALHGGTGADGRLGSRGEVLGTAPAQVRVPVPFARFRFRRGSGSGSVRFRFGGLGAQRTGQRYRDGLHHGDVPPRASARWTRSPPDETQRRRAPTARRAAARRAARWRPPRCVRCARRPARAGQPPSTGPVAITTASDTNRSPPSSSTPPAVSSAVAVCPSRQSTARPSSSG